MIVLDTNVLSEMIRPVADASVMAWLDNQPTESLWTTAITVFEIRFGLRAMPQGRRRMAMEAVFEHILSSGMGQRVLPFDTLAADHTARLAIDRKKAGRPVDFHDTAIAGIALSRRASIATRNIRHFTDLDVQVINPWND